MTSRFVIIPAQVALSALGFMVVARGDPRALNTSLSVIGATALVVALLVVLLFRRRESGQTRSTLQLLVLGGATGTLALSAVYAVSFYLRIPADLLGFAEGQFVGDLIRIRSGGMIYTPAADNNAYPYMPGTQYLTYALGALAGFTHSIVAWRVIQYGYVLGAAVVGAFAAMELGRHLGSRVAPGWFAIFVAILVLVSGDPRFNLYTHTLHNDGLSLLVSMTAFLVLARHVRAPTRMTNVLLVLLPPLGLLVKQNGIVWMGLIALCVLLARPSEWRQVIARGLASLALAVSVVVFGYMRWGGQDFLFWVFGALGVKNVSLFRSVYNLLEAGVYASFFLGAIIVLRAQRAGRGVWALLLTAVLVFGVNGYTSGIGFQANHLGPGVMLASIWALAVTARLWEVSSRQLNGWIAAALYLVVPGGLGLVRYPRDHVPLGLRRYVAAIQSEFDGGPRSNVLLDDGNWMYLDENVVMRDRGASVSVHLGANQEHPGYVHLVETAERIRRGEYRRVLVRNFEAGQSLYGFGLSDSPVVAALNERYVVVRRIPPVKAAVWWPELLLGEVDVLEPRRGTDER